MFRLLVDSRQTVSLPLPPPTSPTRSETVEPSRPIHTVMNSFVSVAKQAGSTAKAIFNTLQANDTVRFSETIVDRLIRRLFI